MKNDCSPYALSVLFFNPLTLGSDQHVTSPYYIHVSSSRGIENTQSYQVEVVVLI